MPTEVLSEIFLLTTIPAEADSETLDLDLMSVTPVFSLKVKTTPFALSQVCRRWRNIVNDTKAMWRSVTILNPNEQQLYRLRLWMDHVGNYPLEVAVFLNYGRIFLTQNDEDMIQRVLELLGQHLSRWSTFEFRSPRFIPPTLCHQMKELNGVKSSILRKAIISYGLSSGTVEELWTSLHGIQSLETLHFNSDHVYRAARQSNPRLRVLRFTPYWDDERIVWARSNLFVEILSPFPNIEELCIDTDMRSYRGWQDDESLPPVVLQRLKSLRITARNFLSLFCRRFITPSLEILDITSNNIDDADNVAYLLQRSESHLKKLVLHIGGVGHVRDWLESDTFKSVADFSVTYLR